MPMTPYMYSAGISSGFPFLAGLHGLGMLLVLCGVVLLLTWAIKHLPAAQQKKWGIILVAVGAVLCLLTLFGSVRRPANSARKNPTPLLQNSMMSARSAMMQQASSKAAAR